MDMDTDANIQKRKVQDMTRVMDMDTDADIQ